MFKEGIVANVGVVVINKRSTGIDAVVVQMAMISSHYSILRNASASGKNAFIFSGTLSV